LEDLLVILVVDDDPMIHGIVEAALTDGGFELAIAPSGEEAVTLLKENKSKYRALVTDIDLGRGKMDGWEVARHAREIDLTLPIIYMTAASADKWGRKWCPRQHSPDQTLRARATCHCRFPASQYRYADNVRPPRSTASFITRKRPRLAPQAVVSSSSAEQPHPLDSVAEATTILNDVHSFLVRGAFLELHWLVANNAAKEIDQRAFIVVGRRGHFPFAFQAGRVLSEPVLIPLP
jgi:CheY-like chemotaxis protein